MDNSVAATDRSSERPRPEEVKEKLLSKEYILRKKEGAQVWIKFDEVVDATTLQPQGYVRCKFCLNFMRYDSHRTGTSHLNRHKCGSKLLAKGTKERGSSPSTPLSGIKYNPLPSPMIVTLPSPTANRTANSKLQQDLLDKCVTLCCKDIRPFDLFSGEGFRDLAQCLINVGTSVGKVDVSTLLPSPSLLAARTLDIVTEIKAHILPELDEAVTDYGAGITIDVWSDEQRSYLTTTIFYVHRDWKLVKRVLSTSQFDSGSENDGDTFKNLLVGNLYGFGLDPSTICNLVYVIKPDLVVTSALNSFRRIDCSSAIIDKLLEMTFDCSYLTKHAPEIAKVLSGSVMIVSYMKQSGLIQDIPTSFIKKEDHRTWKVKLELLMFVREHYDLISQTVFPQQDNGDSLQSIHLDILIFLIDFLQPFKEAVEDLEDFQYPTINLVLPWYCKLLRHTQPAITDTSVMSLLKSKAHQAICDTFSIHILHKVATFLWPEFKLLKMISKVEQDEVHNAIRDMISHEKNEMSIQEIFGGDAEQPEKKRKVTFSQWQDDTQQEDDVSNYVAMKVEMSDERDLLGWWSSKTKLFPGLSKLARSILAIPASSCSTDSGISISRKIFQDRRSTLSPDTVDGVLFLHSNLG